MRLEDLMERAAQYDENLARDIKDYVHAANMASYMKPPSLNLFGCGRSPWFVGIL